MTSTIGATGQQSGHHVHTTTTRCLRAFNCPLDAGIEIRFPARKRGQPTLSCFSPPGRYVEKHQRHTYLVQATGKRIGLDGMTLDA
jgi:hypothetical protein